jgi:hypothetical protein
VDVRTCSATSPTPTAAPYASDSPVRCQSSTRERSNSRFGLGSRSTAPWRPQRSTGRTTSTRTCRRTTRSPSTTSRSTLVGGLISPMAVAWGSPVPTWKRTPASPPTSVAPVGSTALTPASSTTTAPACPSSRSSRSPTCAVASRLVPTSLNCAPSSSRLGPPMVAWRKARCASTPTCRCASPATPSGPAVRSRT